MHHFWHCLLQIRDFLQLILALGIFTMQKVGINLIIIIRLSHLRALVNLILLIPDIEGINVLNCVSLVDCGLN